MTYTQIWMAEAGRGLLRLLQADPDLAHEARRAIRALSEEPSPPTSTPLGQQTLRRLRVGAIRVVYEIDEKNDAIIILTVGRSAT